MKKKISAIALVGVMAIGLVGCGNRKEVTKNDPTTENAETITIESETSDRETELETTEKEDNEIVTTESPEEETTEEDIPVEYEVIQKDCYYYVEGYAYNTIYAPEIIASSVLEPGDVMPLKPHHGDVYETPDYMYSYFESKSDQYPSGWNVTAKDNSSHGEIRETIASEPVVYMIATFIGSDTIVESPIIPDSVEYMIATYAGADNLKKVPNFPNNLVDLSAAFYECGLLEEVPEIPDSVITMDVAFYLSGLIRAPKVPSSVKTMVATFGECKNMTGEIVFDANPEEYVGCFMKVDFIEQNLTISGKTKLIPELRESRKDNGNIGDLVVVEYYEGVLEAMFIGEGE